MGRQRAERDRLDPLIDRILPREIRLGERFVDDDDRFAAIDVEHRGFDENEPALRGLVAEQAGRLADDVQPAPLARLRVEPAERLLRFNERQGTVHVHPFRVDGRQSSS